MHIQRKYIDIVVQWNIKLFDIKIGSDGRGQWLVRLLWQSPTTTPHQTMPVFVRKSNFFARSIVHPTGGGAAKLVCESCGAEYPYIANAQPCSFCAVMKESGIQLRLGRWSWDRLWSEHGWGIMDNGYWLGPVNEVNGTSQGVVAQRFNWKHKAQSEVNVMRRCRIAEIPETMAKEWQEGLSHSAIGASLTVEIYPLKPVQPVRPDPNAIQSIMCGRTGIGAKAGTGTLGKSLGSNPDKHNRWLP